MFDIQRMLDELGDGNEFTKKFITDCRYYQQRGWTFTEGRINGLAKVYFRQFGKEAPILGQESKPETKPEIVRITNDGRIVFKSFTNLESATIYQVTGGEKILICPRPDGFRKFLRNDKNYPGYSSISIKHELVVLNKKPENIELGFEETKIGLVVDLSTVPTFDYFGEMNK